jgi:hypothetical protein
MMDKRCSKSGIHLPHWWVAGTKRTDEKWCDGKGGRS